MRPAGLVALLLLSPPACDDPPPTPAPATAPAPKPAPKPPPPAWPAPGARLTPPAVSFPAGFGKPKIYLDAGHGNPGNSGNESCLCIEEQTYNLGLAKHIAPILTNTGHFEVKLSRTATPGPKYRPRLTAAKAFGADAIVSIHSDVRGEGTEYSPAPGKKCMRNPDAPGFSVLWSDEGPAGLAQARHRLAKAVATRLAQTGFLPYSGEDYEDLYTGDPTTPGVFLDRHQPGQRILFLRKPKIPSIIIETHHAWDPREERRFQESGVRDAFGQALASGLVEFFSVGEEGSD